MFDSLIRKNEEPHGIPQGASISDLLANLYLIDFDKELNDIVGARDGIYLRYSDDILILVPGDRRIGIPLRDAVIEMIENYGRVLTIKRQKCAIVEYVRSEGAQDFVFVDGNQGKNGLEYLGFRFDGRRIFLHDSTLSAFYRKIAFAARREARKAVAKHYDKDLCYIIANFNYNAFIKQFGRVENFDEHHGYRNWTFWTYAQRAVEIMGPRGQPILRQISRHRVNIRRRLEYEIRRAAAKAGP